MAYPDIPNLKPIIRNLNPLIGNFNLLGKVSSLIFEFSFFVVTGGAPYP